MAAGVASAQSRENAVHLHKEACALPQNARSHEELKQAAGKYGEALRVYNRVGDKKNAGYAYNSLAIIYADWGKYDEVMELYENSLAISRDLKGRPGEERILMGIGIKQIGSASRRTG